MEGPFGDLLTCLNNNTVCSVTPVVFFSVFMSIAVMSKAGSLFYFLTMMSIGKSLGQKMYIYRPNWIHFAGHCDAIQFNVVN